MKRKVEIFFGNLLLLLNKYFSILFEQKMSLERSENMILVVGLPLIHHLLLNPVLNECY